MYLLPYAIIYTWILFKLRVFQLLPFFYTGQLFVYHESVPLITSINFIFLYPLLLRYVLWDRC